MGAARRLAAVAGAAAVAVAASLPGAPAGAAVTPAITLSGPATGAEGSAITLSGTLTADAPGGATVTLAGTDDPDGPRGPVAGIMPTVTTAPDGSFTATYTPTLGGSWTFSVAALGATATWHVRVDGASTYLWPDPVPAFYPGQSGHVAVTLYSVVGRPAGGLPVSVVTTVQGVATTTTRTTSGTGAVFVDVPMAHWSVASARFTFAGAAGLAGSTRNQSVVPTRIPVSVPASFVVAPARPYDPLRVTGDVTPASGRIPAGTTVSVRSCDPVGCTLVTGAPVAADGTFTSAALDARAGRSTYTVTPVLAPAADYTVTPASLTTDLPYLPSSLTVAYDPAAPQTFATPSRVTARLTLDGAPAAGRTLSLGNDPCTDIPGSATAVTDATGTARWTVVPQCMSATSVHAAFQDRHHAAQDVALTGTPRKAATTFQVATETGAVSTTGFWAAPYDPKILSFTNLRGLGRGSLAVYEQPYGRAKVLVGRFTTVNGQVTLPWRTYDRNTTMTVVFGGDTGSLARTQSFWVGVRPLPDFQLLNDDRGTAYQRFRHGSATTTWGRLTPDHPSATLKVVTQQLRGGVWVTVSTRSLTGRALGAGAAYRIPAAVGARYRVRMQFAGDADHYSVASGWRYFLTT